MLPEPFQAPYKLAWNRAETKAYHCDTDKTAKEVTENNSKAMISCLGIMAPSFYYFILDCVLQDWKWGHKIICSPLD